MKKNYLLLVMMLLVGMLPSCSKDEGGDGTGLTGKWQLIKSSDKDAEPCMFEGYVEFTGSGKYLDKTGCANDNGNGTWSQNESEVTITADVFPLPIVAKIKELSETTLTLEMEFMGFKNTDTYQRVK